MYPEVATYFKAFTKLDTTNVVTKQNPKIKQDREEAFYILRYILIY